MSVKYKKVQSNMRGNSSFGKWYGKAVVSDVVDVDMLSSNIGNRCTVTKPDIVAVISALVDEMKAQLQMGNRVVLDGFGSFKVGMSTKPAETAKEFTANNVKRLHHQPDERGQAQHRHTGGLQSGGDGQLPVSRRRRGR